MRTRINRSHVLRWMLLALFALPCITIFAGNDGVMDTLKKATERPTYGRHLDLEPALPVRPVQVEARFRGTPMWTDSRKARIQRFKCSRCHNNQTVSMARAAEIAHGDIRLDHGGVEKPLDCFTCHHKDDRDSLIAEKGAKTDMDHSYRICSQCHFRQSKDWVGGAHGKRIDYWSGKRVVRNCASCHDPHSPRFEKRWPVIYSPPSAK